MYWTLELASKLEDAPWPATKEELIDYVRYNIVLYRAFILYNSQYLKVYNGTAQNISLHNNARVQSS